MKFYYLPSERRFVARLADIPKGVPSEVVDVGTDQPSLMERLNQYEARLGPCMMVDTTEQADEVLATGAGVGIDFAALRPQGEPISVAAQQMRQLDVEDAIQRANPVELNAYASNVFDRFRDLHRELKNSETPEN